MDSFTKSRISRLEADVRSIFESIEKLKKEDDRSRDSINALVRVGENLNNRITALEETSMPTKDEEDDDASLLTEKPIEYQIAWKMLSRCADWFYRKAKEDIGYEGYDTDVESYGNFIDTVRKTGFISISVVNGRAFLYAANPVAFIEFKDMWNDVQAFINSELGFIIAISRFVYPSKNEDIAPDYGEDMTSIVNEFIDGLRKPGQD